MDEEQLQATAKTALKPFDRGASGENPYQIQYDLQEAMQNLVGIVRTESEMQQALSKIASLQSRAEQAGITGPPPVQQRLAHGHRPFQSAAGIGGHHPRRAAPQREPGSAIS